jgi:hypothetical protein
MRETVVLNAALLAVLHQWSCRQDLDENDYGESA